MPTTKMSSDPIRHLNIIHYNLYYHTILGHCQECTSHVMNLGHALDQNSNSLDLIICKTTKHYSGLNDIEYTCDEPYFCGKLKDVKNFLFSFTENKIRKAFAQLKIQEPHWLDVDIFWSNYFEKMIHDIINDDTNSITRYDKKKHGKIIEND